MTNNIPAYTFRDIKRRDAAQLAMDSESSDEL